MIVDSSDPVALGRWWAVALGWVVVEDSPEEFEIRPAPDRVPGLLFVQVPEAKELRFYSGKAVVVGGCLLLKRVTS